MVQKTGRGVVFTQLGPQVLRHARTILAAHDNALDVVIPRLTAALREQLPDWRVRFRLDRNVSLADSIERGLLDLAVMLDGSGLSRTNVSGVIELTWIASHSFSLQPANHYPVVAFAEPCTFREATFAALDKAGDSYQVVAECANLAGLHAAIRSGLGSRYFCPSAACPTV